MNRVKTIVERGIREGILPGAVLLVAMKGRVLHLEAFGNRILVPDVEAMSAKTVFDLASLTKVFSTTLAIMKLVDGGLLGLDETLQELLPSAALGDKKMLTPRLFLTHSSGLPDHRPFFRELVVYPPEQRKKVLREWIVREPFIYEPGRGTLYSDLGFMLLEWVIEARTGRSLREFVEEHFYRPLGLENTFFRTEEVPLSTGRVGAEGGVGDGLLRFAATEYCSWRKRVLVGEVDDENAFALGGYSGHAGLFSTAEEVWILSDLLRSHYLETRSDFFSAGTVKEFFTRQEIVQGSDWALGWDTRAPEGSSAGRFFSRNSVGHTGFTGTSVWMDLVKDVTVVFLANRVHPTRNNTEAFKAFRPKVHDAVMEELGKIGVLERL